MSIEQNLETFVLNIPAILELRQQVAGLSECGTADLPEDLSPSLWDAVSDVATDMAERYFETQVDMAEAVESAIAHGYVDLSSALDYDEIVSNSSEFGDVQSLAQDNKDAIEELTSALDNLSDANDSAERITQLEQIVADLESRLDEVMSRLDNASLDI